LAMINYATSHNQHFPPYQKAIGGATGSWVVCILPELGQKPLFKFWTDGQSKERYLELMTCPSDPPIGLSANQSYLSFRANAQVCTNNNGKGRSITSIGDGTSSTLLIGEMVGCSATGRRWGIPSPNVAAITFQGNVAMNTEISSNHPNGSNVIFCDSHNQFISSTLSNVVYAALCSPDGGESVDDTEY